MPEWLAAENHCPYGRGYRRNSPPEEILQGAVRRLEASSMRQRYGPRYVRIQPKRVLLRPRRSSSAHRFAREKLSSGIRLAGVTGDGYPTPRSTLSMRPPAASEGSVV